MASNVVAFVGENENGILAELSRSLMEPLPGFGLRGHVIDLHDPDWPARFQPLAMQGLAFGWGSAGIGSGLKAGEDNLWDALRVPFVSVLADTPCQLPAHHRIAARHVANGYTIADWLDVQRRFIRSPQISATLPGAVPPNAERDTIPWQERPHRMVFVKTGEDPAPRRAGWQEWPAPLRALAEEAAEEAARRPTGEITVLVAEIAVARGLHLEERPEILLTVTRQVDLYIRARRSDAFARALLPLGATIIGRGWDHLPRDGARATLHPAIPAAELSSLYARTQFVVSTNPNFARGIHERPVNAFAARACAVSDENAFTRERFAALPTWFGLDWTAPDLADRIAAIFHDRTDHGPHTDAGLVLAGRDFAPERFLRGLIDLADLVRATQALPRLAA